MTDLAVKAVLTADGKQLVGAATEGAAALDKLKTSAKGVGDQSKAAANDHDALGKSIQGSGKNAQDASEKFKLNSNQIRELTFSARHLFEEIGAGTPITTIFTTQVGHLSSAFTDANQISGLFGIAMRSVWTWAGLAAAGVAALALATVNYEGSVRGVINAVSGQGNPFGLTAQQALDASHAIAMASDESEKSGRKMVATLQGNNIAPQYWNDLAKAARGYANVTGDDVPTALEKLAGKLKDPAAGAKFFKDDLNLLSGAQLDQIEKANNLSGVYSAQGPIVDALSERFGQGAQKVSGFSGMLRELRKSWSDWYDDLGKTGDKVVPGKFDVGDVSINNTDSDRVRDLSQQYDSYGTTITKLRTIQQGLNSEIRSGTLQGEDLKNAQAALAGVNLQVTLTEKAHADQLRALNPLEQARFEHLKSLIAGSEDAVAAARQQAESDQYVAESATGTQLSIQDANDAMEVFRKTLPYVTAEGFATGGQLDKLKDIVHQLTIETKDDQALKHYADAIRDVKEQFGHLSDLAPADLQQQSYGLNLKQLDEWRTRTLDSLRLNKLAYAEYAGYVEAIFHDKLGQMYLDDLAHRKDWVAGAELGFHDLNMAQQDWASTARNLTVQTGQEFENDFVDAVLRQKDPLEAFFNWYLEQLLRVIYQQKLASSFNGVAGGLTDAIGSIFGMGGGGLDSVVSSSIAANPLLFHSGGAVGAGGISRSVDPSVFAGAPRFHGGTGGLNVGERAAILKDDEHVSTADQYADLTARPSVYVVGGGNSAAPQISFNIINNSSVALQGKEQGKPRQKGGGGGFDMDVLVTEIEHRMAGNIRSGSSPVATQLEASHNLRRTPS